MGQKRIDHETKKKIRQYGKHARWTIKGTKGVSVASQELIEAVKKKDTAFLQAEEEAKEKARKEKEEERERKRAVRKEAKERVRLAELAKQEAQERVVRQEIERQEQEVARVERDRLQKEEVMGSAMEVLGLMMRPPMSRQERDLLLSLKEVDEKEKCLREIAAGSKIDFESIIHLVRSRKEWRG